MSKDKANLANISLEGLFDLRAALKAQEAEVSQDLEDVREELEKRIQAGGLETDENGSQALELINDEGTHKGERKWTDRLSFQKGAEDALEEEGFNHLEIFKERTLDPKKVKALRDGGRISDKLWDSVVKSRGSWTIKVSFCPHDDEEKKTRAEAAEVF